MVRLFSPLGSLGSPVAHWSASRASGSYSPSPDVSRELTTSYGCTVQLWCQPFPDLLISFLRDTRIAFLRDTRISFVRESLTHEQCALLKALLSDPLNTILLVSDSGCKCMDELVTTHLVVAVVAVRSTTYFYALLVAIYFLYTGHKNSTRPFAVCVTPSSPPQPKLTSAFALDLASAPPSASAPTRAPASAPTLPPQPTPLRRDTTHTPTQTSHPHHATPTTQLARILGRGEEGREREAEHTLSTQAGDAHPTADRNTETSAAVAAAVCHVASIAGGTAAGER